jgi:protocatechuate 3,4-dioxygenase alpha subunit
MTTLPLQQTPSQTVGPFFQEAFFRGGENELTSAQTSGQHITITGTIYDGDGKPVPDAVIEIWQADANGRFAHPADPEHARADPHFRGYGRSDTRDGGRFHFTTVKPGRVVRDGQPASAPYINVRVLARGMLIHAVTRLYFADESANAGDPVLALVRDPARRQTLIAEREEGGGLPTYRFDIHLQGPQETVFFNP